jgi:hypothetical protein
MPIANCADAICGCALAIKPAMTGSVNFKKRILSLVYKSVHIDK